MDRKGGKRVLLASHLVFAAALAVIGLSTGPVSLTVGMLLLGFGMAFGLSPTPFAILVALKGQRARRPITAVALIGGLGSTVGWPVTAWLAEAYGWRGACFIWAGLQLVTCLPLAAAFVPQAVPAPHAPDKPHAPVRWDRGMIQLAVLFACAWLVSTCMSAHLPRLLHAFGLPMAAATAAAGLLGVAAVTARFLEFTVLRKLDPLHTTRVATVMHPAGAAALVLGGPQAGAALAVGQGLGNGMLTVAKGVLPLKLYGPENYAYRSALLSRPAQLLQAAGPLTFGLLLDRSATLALASTCLLCLVMFAMTFGLERQAEAAPGPVAA